MQLARSASAARVRAFGRGPQKQLELFEPDARPISDDLKLFVTTFAAGFLFVSVLLF